MSFADRPYRNWIGTGRYGVDKLITRFGLLYWIRTGRYGGVELIIGFGLLSFPGFADFLKTSPNSLGHW